MRIQRRDHTSILQKAARILLGTFMVFAGVAHLTFQRKAFQAQVPDFVPVSKDLTVVLSGYVEIALGLTLIFWRKQRINTGFFLAVFFILVFPGNIAQYVGHKTAFGLDNDQKRLGRLFFQPVLILWALWSTGALSKLVQQKQLNNR
ncbi:MAG: hypothetical protein WKF66_12925 [Pedobacter sp.]